MDPWFTIQKQGHTCSCTRLTSYRINSWLQRWPYINCILRWLSCIKVVYLCAGALPLISFENYLLPNIDIMSFDHFCIHASDRKQCAGQISSLSGYSGWSSS